MSSSAIMPWSRIATDLYFASVCSSAFVLVCHNRRRPVLTPVGRKVY